jgi:SAM-dependent methyltransferase
MSAPKPDDILQLAQGFMAAKTLLAAVELDVFGALAGGPLPLDALREKTTIHRRSARDFFDTLVALGMLERDERGYANTAVTAYYLDPSTPSYIGGFLRMLDLRLYGFFGSLATALRTGEPQNESRNGEDLFAALYADPARLRLFLQSMTGISLPSARALAAAFPWSRYQTFVDVGCAQGGLPVEVALAHPHLTGIGFDLPVVQPVFDEYVRSFGLESRLRFAQGSFFADPLPHADVIVMGHILHDWDLEQKRMLIRKAYDALSPGGAFIAYDAIIDDDRRRHVGGLLLSLTMLIETGGGFDYTGADGCGWMREAGFRDPHVVPLAGIDSMIVGMR